MTSQDRPVTEGEPVIDPHHHLWDLEQHHYPWLQEDVLAPRLEGDIRPIAKSYLLEDYWADTRRQHVVKSVHVECGWVSSDPVGETAWLQSLADQHGFPQGIVARATLEAANIQQILEGHARFPNVRGVRQSINWHIDPAKTFVSSPDLMRSKAWQKGFARLQHFGFSFDLQLYPGQLAEAASIARMFPETLIILNHTGMPVDREKEGIRAWLQGMQELAASPNVAVKISGLGTVDWHWTIESIRPFVLNTIDVFGVSRCMFASNFPVDKLYSDFDTLYGAFRRITKSFTKEERQLMFHDNAVRFYRL